MSGGVEIHRMMRVGTKNICASNHNLMNKRFLSFAALLWVLAGALYAQSTTFKKTYAGKTGQWNITMTGDEADLFLVTTDPAQGKASGDTLKMFLFSADVMKGYLSKKLTDLSDSTLTRAVADLFHFYDRPKVSITGNGMANYTTSTKGVTGSGAAAGFGVIVNWPSGRRINVMGTVTQTRDTIESVEVSDFAQTILVPGIRRLSIMAIYRDLYALKQRSDGSGWGWGAFVNATPINWKTFRYTSVGSEKRDSVPTTSSVNPITLELFFSNTLIYQANGRNTTRITLDMGVAAKYLGDNSMSAADHRLFLDTTQDLFAGPLLGIDLRVADSHIYFYGTYLIQGKQGGVPGLTGPQLQAGLSLSATIADLTKK